MSSRNLGTLISWNPLGTSGPVTGLLCIYMFILLSTDVSDANPVHLVFITYSLPQNVFNIILIQRKSDIITSSGRYLHLCYLRIFFRGTGCQILRHHHHHHHHHHIHQGLDPLIRSVSRVTAARANASSVFQLFSFLVVCSVMISKGIGFVAFFASVKASSVCIHLSCLVCL